MRMQAPYESLEVAIEDLAQSRAPDWSARMKQIQRMCFQNLDMGFSIPSFAGELDTENRAKADAAYGEPPAGTFDCQFLADVRTATGQARYRPPLNCELLWAAPTSVVEG